MPHWAHSVTTANGECKESSKLNSDMLDQVPNRIRITHVSWQQKYSLMQRSALLNSKEDSPYSVCSELLWHSQM